MIVGEPFSIGNVTWTPSDQLNYDEVGYASIGTENDPTVSAAHKTLPLPSYAEVTSLETGRTILIRIERRGPMVNDTLIELSQGAAEQLGLAASSRTAIRLRRTNPPEQERAMLRRGTRAPERMETPETLLKVLRRKLAEQAPLLAPSPAATTSPSEATASTETATAPVTPSPQPLAAPASDTASSGKEPLVVQAAAFAVEANARRATQQLGGFVERAGKYWHVRIGPFANRVQAAAALEKARTAGYRDARIQRAD